MSGLKPIVVIVESPAKCKKIEGFLGPGYKVIASFGHITTLNSLKDVEINNNFNPNFSIIPSKKPNIAKLQVAIKNSSKVIIATDDDREGEAIGYHICKLFKLPVDTTERIIFNEITKSAIQNAVKRPTTLNINLINAALARQVLDIIVGFTISPILWKKFARNSKTGLSAGRCQSPALRLIYDNQKMIENTALSFVYTTTGYFTSHNIPFILNKQFTSQDEGPTVEQFLEESVPFEHYYQTRTLTIRYKNPPQPFTTSSLQQSANSNLRTTPKETMKICQKLYENGLITYMRTDSKIYSKEFIGKAKDYIKENYGNEFINKDIESLSERDKKPTKSKKKKEENKAQEAHEAIRPTDITKINITDFEPKEIKMYSLIWRNTIESCMSECKYNSLNCIITAPMELQYKYSCEKIIFPGWKIINDYDKENTIYNYLLNLSNQVLEYNKIYAKVTVKDSKLHYTEAKLVQLLEENGIGRPSTFSSLIDKIQSRGYVKKMNIEGIKKKCIEYELIECELEEKEIMKEFGNEKGKLVIQPIGILVLEFLIQNYDNLFNYEYTKNMENSLDDIAKGNMIWYELCKLCYESINDLSRETDTNRETYKIDDNHTWLIGKYGPVIKCQIGESITWKKVKKDLDINKLKKNEYTLKDIVDNSSYSGKLLGKYQNHDMFLKKGKFGLYVEWGDNKKSLTYLDKNELEITLEDIISFIKKPASSIIRELSEDLSIRNGKYGPYIFYKSKTMKKPQFLKLNGFRLDEGEDYESCDFERLITWISEQYSI